MANSRLLLLLSILEYLHLATAPLPPQYVERKYDARSVQVSSLPYPHSHLENEKEVNDTLPLLFPLPRPKDDNSTIATPKRVPPPPFLHPLLRIKREVDETGILPDSTFKRDMTSTLFPYPHPIVRSKRGVKKGDSVEMETDTQHGTSMEQHEEEHDEEKCYFHKERKTIHEKEERPANSQVKGCGGELRRMSDLFFEEDTALFGAPNKVAVIIGRGGGEYIDWTDASKVKDVGKRLICKYHERELGTNWESKYWHHFKRKTTGGRDRPVCSMPAPFFQHKEDMTLSHEVYRIEAQEAEAILRKKGVLLHPGLPICSAHEEEARKIQAQEAVEGAGHEIRPPPIGGDFSKTPAISKDVNPHYDPRDENDPTYQPSHPKHAASPMEEETFMTASELAKKNAYLQLMNAFGVPSHISKKAWHELSERTKRRQSAALKHVVKEVAMQMNSDNPDALIEKTFKPSSDYERPRSTDYLQMMENLKEALESTDSKADRLAFLSLFTRLSLPEIRRYIPNLSSRIWDQAKKYAKRGYYIDIVEGRRIKYSFAKVERFIEFLTSYKVTIGLPYGTRRVRDSQKRWVDIPNTLRKLRSGEIYDLYKKELEDDGDHALIIPESTARKMIEICAAEKRKSLHGVDVTIADAMESFDNAEQLIDKLLDSGDIQPSWHATLRSEMLQGRQYIRTDFLVHAKEASLVGDHCWMYGLSDPEDPAFQTKCEHAVYKHVHSQVCDKCEILQIFFGDFRATLENLEKKNAKNPVELQKIAVMRRDLYDWEDKIAKLKAHQLRTAKSEYDRKWIINDLMDGDALLTLDFAMKHMPMRGREPTTDWYGQRGMPWHVTHVTAFKDGEYYQHNLVHILQKDKQDSATVTAIIRHSMQQLIMRGINRIFLRSDQAGAYKSSSTLISVRSIAEEVGMNVVGWIFSEAQAGKGPCDRSSATTKMITRNWCDAGGKVTTPEEFYEAVTKSKLYDGRSYYLVTVQGSGKNKKPVITKSSIAELSKLNAIQYEENNLRVWRFWNIGRGKEISYNKMVPNDARLVVTHSGGALSNDKFWMKMGSPEQIEKLDKTVEEEGQCEKKDKKCKNPKPESKLFRCPIETCSREFLTERHLDIHMTVGKHLHQLEKENVLDYALHQFGVKLWTDSAPRMCPIIDQTIDSIIENNENGRRQPMGWALPKRRKSIRFPPYVKNFLKELYDEGEKTGAKTDAHEAEELMRKKKNNDGTLYFLPEHLLNYRQIAGVYAGFKATKLDKITPEPDEVNDLLFNPEGDPELEFKTEPLFDQAGRMRRAIRDKHADLFDGEEDLEQILGEAETKPTKSWMDGWWD